MKFNYPLDLRSAIAKIDRADLHLKTLKNEIRVFLDEGFYRIETKPYREQVEWTKCPADLVNRLGADQFLTVRRINDQVVEFPFRRTYFSITATKRKEIPVAGWGTLIGDILNNLRGALDNLVWALTEAECGPAPNPVPRSAHSERPWRSVSFPVVTDPRTFDQKNHDPDTGWRHVAQQHLWGLRPSLRTRIKKIQPFYGRKYPETHWLAQLNELWNADKHRMITPICDIHQLNRAHLELFWPHRLTELEVKEDFATRVLKIRQAGPFESDTEEIARFWIRPLRLDARFREKLNVGVNASLLFDIAFQGRTPMPGQPITFNLERFFYRTLAVVHQFQAPDTW